MVDLQVAVQYSTKIAIRQIISELTPRKACYETMRISALRTVKKHRSPLLHVHFTFPPSRALAEIYKHAVVKCVLYLSRKIAAI